MSLITNTLGSEIWEKAVICLTQANEREERLAARRERVQQSIEYCHVIDGFSGKLRSYLSTARDTQESSIPLGVIESALFLPAGIYSEGQEILRGKCKSSS